MPSIDEALMLYVLFSDNTAFLLNLANMDGADRSIPNLAFVPAHYMEQFHPEFADQAELGRATVYGYFESLQALGRERTLARLLPHVEIVGEKVARLADRPVQAPSRGRWQLPTRREEQHRVAGAVQLGVRAAR